MYCSLFYPAHAPAQKPITYLTVLAITFAIRYVKIAGQAQTLSVANASKLRMWCSLMGIPAIARMAIFTTVLKFIAINAIAYAQDALYLPQIAVCALMQLELSHLTNSYANA